MIELLASPVVGGIVGGIFGFFNKRIELKAIEQQNAHEIAMVEATTQANISIAQMDMEKAKVAGQLAVDKAEMNAFRDSQKNTAPIAEILKAIIRPFILLALGYMSYQVYQATSVMVDQTDGLNPAELLDLYKIIAVSILSLFSMGVGWYFGQRTTKITDKFMGVFK